MKAKEFRYIYDCVEQEGLEYTFRHYSDFSDIDDDEFHKLRKAYLQATEDLINYCGLDE